MSKSSEAYYWAVLQQQAQQQAAAKAESDRQAAERQRQQQAQQQAAEQQAAQQAAANAEAARQAEAARLAAVAAATPPPPPPFDPQPFRADVDSRFAGFTPQFFSSKFSSALAPQTAQIDDQYAKARDQLESLFAARGLSKSSQKNSVFHELDALKGQETNAAQSRAQGFQSTLQSGVDTARNQLYSSIAPGADRNAIGSRAQSEADRLQNTQFSAPNLSDLFGSVLGRQGIATVNAPKVASAGGGFVEPNKQAFATSAGLNLAGGGGGPESSARVVADATKKKKKF